MVWMNFTQAGRKHQINTLELRGNALGPRLVVDQTSIGDTPKLRRLEPQYGQSSIGFGLSGLCDGLAFFICREARAIGQNDDINGGAPLLQQSRCTTTTENFIVRMRRKYEHLLSER